MADNQKKIVICGPSLSGNMGGAALVSGGLVALRAYMPDAKYTLLSLRAEKDSIYSKHYNIHVVGANLWQLPLSLLRSMLWYGLNKVKINFSWLVSNDSLLKSYKNADVILNMTGTSFHDSFGKLVVLKHALWLLPSFLLRKHVVIYSQTLGPFKSRFNQILAHYCLNHVNFLIARGKQSRQYLKELGIKKPIYIKADAGFLLEPVFPERAKDIFSSNKDALEKVVVGVTVNSAFELIFKGEENKYIELMAELFDYVVERLNGRLIFISHAEGDMNIAGRINAHMKMKDKSKIIDNTYTVEELKGIIGRCDLFIGSRFHSIVASLSMAVPTVAIGWSHKYHEVMAMFGQESYVFDFNPDMGLDEVKNKVDCLWKERRQIKTVLLAKVRKVKESALSCGKFIKELVDSKDNR